MTIELDVGGRRRTVELSRTARGWRARLDGRELTVEVAEAGGRWSLLAGADTDGPAAAVARSYDVAFTPGAGPGELIVVVDGDVVPVTVADPRSWRRRRGAAVDAAAGAEVVTAPMPGRVVKVLVQPGTPVTARQPLVVVEAMKMENELRARRPGTVREVRATEGASVEAGAVLVVLE